MAALALPNLARTWKATPSLMLFGAQLDPPLGGASQRLIRLGSRYKVTFDTIGSYSAADAAALRAVLLEAADQGVTVTAPFPQSTLVDPTLLGTPLVNGATQAGTALITDGWAAPTNLLTWSEAQDNVAWTKSNLTAAAGAGLDSVGLLTADSLTRTATASATSGQTLTKAASALAYTLSIEAKRSVGDFFALDLQRAGSGRADACFNLASGTISQAASASGTFSAPSATITGLGGGIFRLTLSVTSDTGTAISGYVSPSSVSQKIDDTGSANGVVALVSRAQIEQAAAFSKYRKATTGQIAVPAGSFFSLSISGRLYLYANTRDIVVNAAGQATLTISPRLRASPADNAPLTWINPLIEGFPSGQLVDWALGMGTWTDFPSLAIAEAR